MAFREFERLSPNRALARHERLGVLFHHTGSLDFDGTVAKMLRPESQVSYHCLIGRDGSRCSLVRDQDVAWHAGASRFLGRERCNDFLLGLAFEGDTYALPLTQAQVGSALEWLDARWAPLGWGIGRLTDHRQVSPGRKDDLNPVQWDALLAAVAEHFRAAPANPDVSGLKSPPPSRT
jgi:N-acetyl-anhydromuramoyl-L-alanine amidase